MTEFKYLEDWIDNSDARSTDVEPLIEIAYQLKRQADATEALVNLLENGLIVRK